MGTYTSIFDGATIITKKDLCKILNLDTSRPGLKFSPSEIQKAYKQRALRFHPDKQKNQKPSIPTEICNTLMNDIALARDYMLKGEDNIPGKVFIEKSRETFTLNSHDGIDRLIKALNGIQSGTQKLSSTILWLSRFSRNFFIILFLSTFSNNQLNLNMVNELSKELKTIRPFLKGIDAFVEAANGAYLARFLLRLKKVLESNEQDNTTIKKWLGEYLPQSITESKNFEQLLIAIKAARNELVKMLTKDFIGQLNHIVQFWIHFIATVPSWRHIIGVYFTSLLFTATSLPKYFNAVKIITEVIRNQKGTISFIMSLLPLLILSVALLPINIAIQLSFQLTWIALKACYEILVNGYQLLYSAMNMVRSLFVKDIYFSQMMFNLLESTLNLTIRLAFNIAIEVLDEIIFIVTGQSLLGSFQNRVNEWLDATIHTCHPKIKKEIPAPNVASQNNRFFDGTHAPSNNKNDVFLEKILSDLNLKEQSNKNTAALVAA